MIFEKEGQQLNDNEHLRSNDRRNVANFDKPIMNELASSKVIVAMKFTLQNSNNAK